MSNNDYTNQLAKRLRALPAVAMRGVLRSCLQHVVFMTVQDSGNAAMNWHVTKGDEATPDFKFLYGVGAVGTPGQKRSARGGTMPVVHSQVSRFDSKYPDYTKFLSSHVGVVSNNIANPYYQRNSMVQLAGASVTSGLVNGWVSSAMRHAKF